MKKIKKTNTESFAIQDYSLDTNWKDYLKNLHQYLTKLGFKKYKQNIRGENFAYWKKYDDKYQIGLLVYDFTIYDKLDSIDKVRIQFQCMPINIDYRCDLVVSRKIELHEFENMAKTFYESMVDFF